MSVPKQNELNRPVLEFVAGSGGRMPLKEIRGLTIDHFDITEDDMSETISSGHKRFDNRVRWSVSYLKRAGLLHSPSDSTYEITPEGTAFLETHTGTLRTQTLQQLIEVKKQDLDPVPEPAETNHRLEPGLVADIGALEDGNPNEQLDAAFHDWRESFTYDLLEWVSSVSPERFERLVVDVLVKMGYGSGKLVGGSGDGGVDGIIDQDPLGLDKIYVQAKRWSNPVPPLKFKNFLEALIPSAPPKKCLSPRPLSAGMPEKPQILFRPGPK